MPQRKEKEVTKEEKKEGEGKREIRADLNCNSQVRSLFPLFASHVSVPFKAPPPARPPPPPASFYLLVSPAHLHLCLVHNCSLSPPGGALTSVVRLAAAPLREEEGWGETEEQSNDEEVAGRRRSHAAAVADPPIKPVGSAAGGRWAPPAGSVIPPLFDSGTND